MLDTHGPKAAETANLWWLMFWISAAVFALVVVLLAIAWLRQIKPRPTDARGLVHLGRLDGLTANGLVLGVGLLLPAAVMVLLLVVDLLEDQQLAGLIMWVPGGLIYLVAALSLFGLWLSGAAAPAPAARTPARRSAEPLVSPEP